MSKYPELRLLEKISIADFDLFFLNEMLQESLCLSTDRVPFLSLLLLLSMLLTLNFEECFLIIAGLSDITSTFLKGINAEIFHKLLYFEVLFYFNSCRDHF